MKSKILTWVCVVVATFTSAALAQELRRFEDRQTFVSTTLGADVSGPLEECVGLTCGDISFSTGIIGCWTPLLDGDDLAISGVENFDVDFDRPVFAFGIEMVEPTNPTGDCTIGGCNTTCTQSTFRVTLFEQQGGAQIGPHQFFNPRDNFATFIGVASTEPFRHVEIRETSGSDDNEHFGRVYASSRPLIPQATVSTDGVSNMATQDIAMLPDQTSLVTWRDEDRTAGRIVDSTGIVSGAQFDISTTAAAGITPVAIAANTGTDFVVVWSHAQDSGGSPFPTDIFGQRVDSTGAKIGSEFQINSYTTNNQHHPAVAAIDSGFLVAWASVGSNTADMEGSSIIGRLFETDGTPNGDEFLINSGVGGNQTKPAAASSTDEFVVIWEDRSTVEIRGQRISATGQRIGNEFLVNNLTTGAQNNPSVDRHPSGAFVVAWESRSSYQGDTSQTYSIQARRFTPTGSPIGSQFQVNSYFPGHQIYSDVVLGANRNFMVVWQSDTSPGTDRSETSILARRFSATGVPIGDDFQINSVIDEYQDRPRVEVGGGSEFVVVWRSYEEFIRQADGGAPLFSTIEKQYLPAADIFFEDHEDGLGSGWSTVQP